VIPARLELPLRAARETIGRHGLAADRCELLQDGHTLVVRLGETLVARIVTDREGPRQGSEWFVRENAVALHLARNGAPVIPLHPDLPPGPYEHLGYTMSFWWFVREAESPPDPREVGASLFRCHEVLRTFPGELPELKILDESLDLLESPAVIAAFDGATRRRLRHHLEETRSVLRHFPKQALHGDAYSGNLMQTTTGLLLTDWEDAFSGPVEWDLASITWNALHLENDPETAGAILRSYLEAGGVCDEAAFGQSAIGRAASIVAWYPVIYPDPGPDRLEKLRRRLLWLESLSGGFDRAGKN
jgi:hypothetical protein